MTFGERLAKFRKAAGLTQTELWRQSGLASTDGLFGDRPSSGTMGAFERGRQQPRLDQIKALAKVLKVTPAQLVSGEVDELRLLVGEGEADRANLRKYNAEYRDRVAELEAERNEARAIARVLAHAYETGSSPPDRMVREAPEFEIDQRIGGEGPKS